jgi:hypothetical protein
MRGEAQKHGVTVNVATRQQLRIARPRATIQSPVAIPKIRTKPISDRIVESARSL